MRGQMHAGPASHTGELLGRLMQSKKLLRFTLLIVVLAGIGFSFALILHFILQDSIPTILVPLNVNDDSLNEEARSGLPVRLTIPSIKVDALIEYVGVTSSGAMDVPKGPDNVAWYASGTRPGEKGSAVIDGHYGWKNGIPAVFDNLYKLQKGDKIQSEDEKGVITTFIVRESRSYDPKADALDVFSSTDGKSHLNLITCEGIWSKFSRNYSKRLVVFADKEI